MEIPSEVKVENFDIEKSPMKEAYKMLGAKTPLELSNLYSERDQELMKSEEWDYNNPELITNKIKNILEPIDPETLTEDEREWRAEIIWFWYHHAISCAAARYKDKEAAQMYATKAVEIQPEDHPNKITHLLFYLVHDRLQEAEELVAALAPKDDEKDTAESLIEGYKEIGFFKKE
jgi:hypothetical protein